MQPRRVPAYLTHYYERRLGPLRSLSTLPQAEAEQVLAHIRQRGDVFASRRAPDYVSTRFALEQRMRQLFIAKGGQPRLAKPHYFVVGSCAWCRSWYGEGAELRIPLQTLDPAAVSFTYGDSFPAMRFQDGKPYRKQVYTLAELPGLVAQFGLPQDWNPEGKLGPDRYIEAQVWSEVAA